VNREIEGGEGGNKMGVFEREKRKAPVKDKQYFTRSSFQITASDVKHKRKELMFARGKGKLWPGVEKKGEREGGMGKFAIMNGQVKTTGGGNDKVF